MSGNQDGKRALLVFLLTASVSGLGITLLANWKVAIPFSVLIGLFASFHQARSLSSEVFEINATNKDKLKGLSWYEAEIVAHLNDLDYELIQDSIDLKRWRPSPRARVMGGEVSMRVSPYSITIEGPRGVVRILKSIVDINKIFL